MINPNDKTTYTGCTPSQSGGRSISPSSSQITKIIDNSGLVIDLSGYITQISHHISPVVGVSAQSEVEVKRRIKQIMCESLALKAMECARFTIHDNTITGDSVVRARIVMMTDVQFLELIERIRVKGIYKDS